MPDTASIKIRLLGTGTSQGVPIIGCRCEVCQSPDPRDARLRCAALIEAGDARILIDAGPDFRQQMLREKAERLDAILLTHEHNDHLAGLDDVRPFNFSTGRAMPVFAQKRVLSDVRARFSYAFQAAVSGVPAFDLIEISEKKAFSVAGIDILPIQIWHGPLPILGFRIGDFAYLTDCKTVDPSEAKKLAGLDTLVVSALHHVEHPTHFNLREALFFIEKVKPRRAFLTHISHQMGLFSEVQKGLPEGVSLAWDGLLI